VAAYQPDRGDFIFLNFTPQAGTEQAGRRPAIVLSPQRFNIGTGLLFACPITNQIKGSPFEVTVPRSAKLTGVILTDHLRSVDWIARNAEFHSKAPQEVLDEVLGRLEAILF
jgi:mRNA interferase MazF